MESDTISDTITVSDYFGGCPHCGANHGYMNVRAEHWIVCDAHKVKWRIGSNLFSCWKDENESVWLLTIPKSSRFLRGRGQATPRFANGSSPRCGSSSMEAAFHVRQRQCGEKAEPILVIAPRRRTVVIAGPGKVSRFGNVAKPDPRRSDRQHGSLD